MVRANDDTGVGAGVGNGTVVTYVCSPWNMIHGMIQYDDLMLLYLEAW